MRKLGQGIWMVITANFIWPIVLKTPAPAIDKDYMWVGCVAIALLFWGWILCLLALNDLPEEWPDSWF